MSVKDELPVELLNHNESEPSVTFDAETPALIPAAIEPGQLQCAPNVHCIVTRKWTSALATTCLDVKTKPRSKKFVRELDF